MHILGDHVLLRARGADGLETKVWMGYVMQFTNLAHQTPRQKNPKLARDATRRACRRALTGSRRTPVESAWAPFQVGRAAPRRPCPQVEHGAVANGYAPGSVARTGGGRRGRRAGAGQGTCRIERCVLRGLVLEVLVHGVAVGVVGGGGEDQVAFVVDEHLAGQRGRRE